MDHHRGVAQPGSAPALGAGSRGFKSLRPDQSCIMNTRGSIEPLDLFWSKTLFDSSGFGSL